METTAISKKRRKRIVIYVDPDVHTALKYEGTEARQPIGELVEGRFQDVVSKWARRTEKAS